MAVKALLRALRIEYPRSHDVSDVLIDHGDALPENLRSEVEELARPVSQLASIRGPALVIRELKSVINVEKFASIDYTNSFFYN
ncbi:MAG: hypothetical protein QXT01_02500 [Sulfolobales archaeon]